MRRSFDELIPIEIQPPDQSARQGLWPVLPSDSYGESLSSWLGRTALGNGVGPADIMAELRRVQVRTNLLDVDVELPADAAAAISRWTGNSPQILTSRTLSEAITLLPLPLATRTEVGCPAPRHQFCPICLAEDREPYFRLHWSVSWVVACLTHDCLLVNGCPRCGAGSHTMDIEWHLRDLAQCPFCGADFRNAPQLRANKKVCNGQRFIEFMHMMLSRVDNQAGITRLSKAIGNLPDTIWPRPSPPVVPASFNALPLKERVPYIGRLAGRDVQRQLILATGEATLINNLPEFNTKLYCDDDEISFVRSPERSPLKWKAPSLHDLLHAYYNSPASKYKEPERSFSAVRVQIDDVSHLADVYVKTMGDISSQRLNPEDIGRIKQQFKTLLLKPETCLFFLTEQGGPAIMRCEIGWALLVGNSLLALRLIPNWEQVYQTVLTTLQATADHLLHSYPFDIMEAQVSDRHRSCFEAAGWYRAGYSTGKSVCDLPIQIVADASIHAMERTIQRPTASI
jgi:hypothetical protein